MSSTAACGTPGHDTCVLCGAASPALCRVYAWSSAVCARGTKGCVVNNHGPSRYVVEDWGDDFGVGVRVLDRGARIPETVAFATPPDAAIVAAALNAAENVPSDDAAVERTARALARAYGEEVGFADWLGVARTALRAAGKDAG